MWQTAVSNSPMLIGGGTPSLANPTQAAEQQCQWLDTAVILSKLQEFDSGFHGDMGARLGLWHPRIEKRQGLFYFAKHICSMDRDRTPQWPEWETEEGMVEVPIGYAMMHEDFPVVALGPGHGINDDHSTAYIMSKKIAGVKYIGWAEVFWRVIALKLPGLDASWFARTFGVSMDWIGSFSNPPIMESFQEGKRRGMA